MSKAEAIVLIHRLVALIDDLRDLRWTDATPQHVVTATDLHVQSLTDAAEELRRVHQVTA